MASKIKRPVAPASYRFHIDGDESQWIDVSGAWTRREHRGLTTIQSVPDYFEILHRKATACHITVGDRTISDPADLTPESLDDVDLSVWGFIVGVLYRAAEHMVNLGNFSARLSSDS